MISELMAMDDEVEKDDIHSNGDYENNHDENENENENEEEERQLYPHFTGLEYEALAAKKRKSLTNTNQQGPMKKMANTNSISFASMDEIMETLNYGGRRKSRKKPKVRGRRKGSKNKLSPEIAEMLGDATLHYAHGRYGEAISVLLEVIRLAPSLPDSFHTLGLVYQALGNTERAMTSYWFAAHLRPKDASLWELLFTWSIEQRNINRAMYCISKAISADPSDITVKFHRASLYVELGDFRRAAESYEEILQLCPENVEALKNGAKLYLQCGQNESSVSILENYLKAHPSEADFGVIDLLATTFMEINQHNKALEHIDHAHLVYYAGKELPLNLKIKTGICHIHLGNMKMAESLLSALQQESVSDHAKLITELADSYMMFEHFDSALKYYHMLEENAGVDNDGYLHLKIARCYVSLKKKAEAVIFFYNALRTLEDNVDTRLTLASLLLEDCKEDEAISLLSPPENTGSAFGKHNAWWLNKRIKLKLCHIYKAKGMIEDFVDTIMPLVHLSLEKRSKVCKAKKFLQKKATLKEENKAAARTSGADRHSDDSNDDSLKEAIRDEEHHRLIIDLCKALASLQRNWEALEIISLAQRLAGNTLPAEKEELLSLGAQISYSTKDPKYWLGCVRSMIQRHPHRLAAWNCYAKVISRLEKIYSVDAKFLHNMRAKHKDCVPPVIICGHQFTMACRHQDAAREYLEAYKQLPESPLINLCVGTALINLALGLRLQNKHQCLAQGLAFLYNNLLLGETSQEALYNIARAYHHVGLVSLAASYYEKALAICEKDYPIPKILNEDTDIVQDRKPGYCNLRREAAYNLHLIYRNSGAFDLARQVLKDHLHI
ncbi:TPR_1 domain-containing protein/TPR_9 domain-containing protein [Cephalotus follicularis]|uniref:TPR_1 domain-containing protein/TPR_9 domain-containing protein n=1 Tax=Cephalotus follicularis TaxID=3775 RepID=A0A1Q3BS96_CEPFO|nr:TPR_1 domain-containing protein/TPR_9 domain-containing protein [Cephalotus follicularis]